MMAAPTPHSIPSPSTRGEFAPGPNKAAEVSPAAAGQPFEDLLDEESDSPREQSLPEFVMDLALGLTHPRHPATLGLALAPGQIPLETTPEELTGELLVEGGGGDVIDLVTNPNLALKTDAKGDANPILPSQGSAQARALEAQTNQPAQNATGLATQTPAQTPAQPPAQAPLSGTTSNGPGSSGIVTPENTGLATQTPTQTPLSGTTSNDPGSSGNVTPENTGLAAVSPETEPTEESKSPLESKAEAKSGVRADAKAEAKGELRADAKVDAKNDAKVDSKTESAQQVSAFDTSSDSSSQEEGQPDLSGRQRPADAQTVGNSGQATSRPASSESANPPEFAPTQGARREELPSTAALSREERAIEAPRPVAPNTTTPAETTPAPNTPAAASNVRPMVSTQATPYIDSTQFLQRIEEAAQAVRSGNPNRVDLDVSLNENQSVRVRLEMRAGELITTIRSESRELREMLERAWPEFSARNAERGLRMGEAVFQNSDQGQSQNRSQGDNPSGNRQSFQDSSAGDSNGQFGEQANPRTLGQNRRSGTGTGGPSPLAPSSIPTAPGTNQPTDPNQKVTLWA